MRGPLYIEQLNYLAAVTRMLNETDLPSDPDYYIHVELRDQTTHKPVGSWSDEIAEDCWAYEAKDS